MKYMKQIGADVIDVFKFHTGEIITYLILVVILSAIFHFTGEVVNDIYN
jgi:hypothetical protein